jgi:RNA polymerase sigma-70 factor (ECF subfamily)
VSLLDEKTLKDLVISSAEGDEYAFHLLYERLSDSLFKYILSRTKDRDDAIDILQEVFIDLWKAFQTFTYASESEFYSFIFVITKRKLGKHYKTKRISEPFDENILEHSNQLNVGQIDDARTLLKAIEGLSEKYRTVVELHYWSGLTFGEIGKLVGDKETTVKVRHHRAIKMLEVFYQKHERQ